MELRPVKRAIEENEEFAEHPDCQESFYMTIEFYKKVGFQPPWISYFAQEQGRLVGSAAFKGAPKDGKVEIAYGTFLQFRQQGVGTEICRQLVLLALATDSSVRILARTLPEENYSTKILKKNGFKLLGTIWDEDDDNVWEWEYQK